MNAAVSPLDEYFFPPDPAPEAVPVVPATPIPAVVGPATEVGPVTVTVAAQELGISIPRAYALVECGDLRVARVVVNGRRELRVERAEIERAKPFVKICGVSR